MFEAAYGLASAPHYQDPKFVDLISAREEQPSLSASADTRRDSFVASLRQPSSTGTVASSVRYLALKLKALNNG